MLDTWTAAVSEMNKRSASCPLVSPPATSAATSRRGERAVGAPTPCSRRASASALSLRTPGQRRNRPRSRAGSRAAHHLGRRWRAAPRRGQSAVSRRSVSPGTGRRGEHLLQRRRGGFVVTLGERQQTFQVARMATTDGCPSSQSPSMRVRIVLRRDAEQQQVLDQDRRGVEELRGVIRLRQEEQLLEQARPHVTLAAVAASPIQSVVILPLRRRASCKEVLVGDGGILEPALLEREADLEVRIPRFVVALPPPPLRAFGGHTTQHGQVTRRIGGLQLPGERRSRTELVEPDAGADVLHLVAQRGGPPASATERGRDRC